MVCNVCVLYIAYSLYVKETDMIIFLGHWLKTEDITDWNHSRCLTSFKVTIVLSSSRNLCISERLKWIAGDFLNIFFSLSQQLKHDILTSCWYYSMWETQGWKVYSSTVHTVLRNFLSLLENYTSIIISDFNSTTSQRKILTPQFENFCGRFNNKCFVMWSILSCRSAWEMGHYV